MPRSYEYCRVPYHGEDWQELVEQGWVTMTVNSDGIALMCRERTR